MKPFGKIEDMELEFMDQQELVEFMEKLSTCQESLTKNEDAVGPRPGKLLGQISNELTDAMRWLIVPTQCNGCEEKDPPKHYVIGANGKIEYHCTRCWTS